MNWDMEKIRDDVMKLYLVYKTAYKGTVYKIINQSVFLTKLYTHLPIFDNDEHNGRNLVWEKDGKHYISEIEYTKYHYVICKDPLTELKEGDKIRICYTWEPDISHNMGDNL